MDWKNGFWVGAVWVCIGGVAVDDKRHEHIQRDNITPQNTLDLGITAATTTTPPPWQPNIYGRR
jgi:hypothetical protein